MDPSQDILKEYKFVLSKTKKKLFKKPKYGEASEDLSFLAQTLKNQQCPAYAGLMLHSKSKCEHELGNIPKQIEVLVEAGELFFEAEREIAEIRCISIQNYLNYGVHCFNLALRLQEDHKDFHGCVWLSLKVARLLANLSHYQDALKTMKHALTLLPETIPELVIIRDEIIKIDIVTRDYNDALKHSKFIRGVGKRLPGYDPVLIAKNELTYMLLVMVMRVENGRFEAELQELVSEYHPDDVISKSKVTMVDDYKFFLMQGLLMAYLIEDWDNMVEFETNFDGILTPGQMQLFYIVHTKKRTIR